MRNKLKAFEDIRFTYIATFERYGKNIVSGIEYPTMLFTNLKNSFGDYICDHIWTREVKKFKSLNLKPGDKVIFSAQTKKYKRGYKGSNPLPRDYKLSYDYKLIYIKNIKKIT